MYYLACLLFPIVVAGQRYAVAYGYSGWSHQQAWRSAKIVGLLTAIFTATLALTY